MNVNTVSIDSTLILAPVVVQQQLYPDCWEMYFDYQAACWVLSGGNGVLVYQQSGSFGCSGPNTFDVLVLNATGGPVPDSIVVTPYSATACSCPVDISPGSFVNSVRLYPPSVLQGTYPVSPVGVINAPVLSPPVIFGPYISPCCPDYQLPPSLVLRMSGPFAPFGPVTLTPDVYHEYIGTFTVVGIGDYCDGDWTANLRCNAPNWELRADGTGGGGSNLSNTTAQCGPLLVTFYDFFGPCPSAGGMTWTVSET